MTNPRPPVSWTPCPYCGAKAHEPCRPRFVDVGGRTYPPGQYHADRVKAARP